MKAWWHMEAGKDPSRFGQMLVETAQTIKPNLTILMALWSWRQWSQWWRTALSRHFRRVARCICFGSGDGRNSQCCTWCGANNRRCNAWGFVQKLQKSIPHLQPLNSRSTIGSYQTRWCRLILGCPVIKSTFKHLYIRLIKEPIRAYAER